MSLRSVLRAALAGASRALRAAGRAARIAATPAILVTEAVVDAVTGAVRFVSRLVNPAPAVSVAEAQADAYLDAAAGEPLGAHDEGGTQSPIDTSRFAETHPGLVQHFMRERFPEAALLQDYIKSIAWGGPAFPRPDMSQVPERIMLWLEGLDDGEIERVLYAPLARLDMHLRATHQADLMPALAPVLVTVEARAEAARRREQEIERLARNAGAERAAESVDEFLDDLHAHALEEAGPAPVPFR